MRLRLNDSTGNFEILDRNESVLNFRSPESALAFLRRFKDDPAQMALIRSTLLSNSSSNVFSMSDDEALNDFAALLVSGRIQLLKSLHARRGTASAAEPPAAQTAPAAAPAAQNHWVEFKIVDDQTGQPVPGVQLTIKTPGGSVDSYTTDEAGSIELNGILSGDCEVSCDLRGAQLSNTYTFTRMA